MAGRDAVPAGVEDTAMSPGGSWEFAGSSALRTPVGPGPVKGKSPGYRDGASKDADAPVLVRQTRRFRVARRSDPRDVPAKSGTCAFRRAIPLVRGTEREKDYGRTPAPSK